MENRKSISVEKSEAMRKEEALREFDREWEEEFAKIPNGLLQEEPRFQLTGEIIPPSLRGDKKDIPYSELP